MTIERNEIGLTLEDHNKAFTEISFLLEMFAATIDDLMGGGSATVGRIAGRNMAKKLPIYLPDPKLEDILAALKEYYRAGFEMDYTVDDTGADITYKRCAIRDVCNIRKQPIGGELCAMYHFSIGGVINEILGRPAKGRIDSAGDTECKTRLMVR